MKGNKLDMVELQDGANYVKDLDEIDRMVESFYIKLYEKGDSKIANQDLLDNFLSKMPQLQKLQIDRINSEIMQDELLTTLKSCADSSPGPDGIPYSIIKLTWSIFGPTLTNSWKYALETGELTHSHENSYLKLLPKEGKDLKQLKNWRPITLSNCDFKIITKTLAKKLTEGVSSIINPNQTAYIKNRQITDNLHLLQYAIEKSTELNDGAMIVSLDAEKAFDSIEHWYIKAVL